MSAPTAPVPRPGVLDIAPYIPGKSTATGGAKLHKLSSNETPLGASPAAIAAYKGCWELISSPFYWDKTAHGIHDGPQLLQPDLPQ